MTRSASVKFQLTNNWSPAAQLKITVKEWLMIKSGWDQESTRQKAWGCNRNHWNRERYWVHTIVWFLIQTHQTEIRLRPSREKYTEVWLHPRKIKSRLRSGNTECMRAWCWEVFGMQSWCRSSQPSSQLYSVLCQEHTKSWGLWLHWGRTCVKAPFCLGLGTILNGDWAWSYDLWKWVHCGRRHSSWCHA